MDVDANVKFAQHVDDLKNAVRRLSTPENMKDPKTHRAIYTHIQDIILGGLPSGSQQSATCPPPDIIAYAIRNILYPTFLAFQIPDLLDLLAQMEAFRQHAVVLAEKALAFNEYYTTRPAEDVELLSEQEVERLREQVEKAGAQRKVYLRIVRTTCWLHIHHLCHSEDESHSLFFHFDQYFADEMDKFQRLFRSDKWMTNEEAELLAGTEKNCEELIRKVSDWETEREYMLVQAGLPTDGVSFQRDFAEAFPAPIEVDPLINTIEWYIKRVEKSIRSLQEMFPS